MPQKTASTNDFPRENNDDDTLGNNKVKRMLVVLVVPNAILKQARHSRFGHREHF